MRKESKRSLIERAATKVGLIPDVDQPEDEESEVGRLAEGSALTNYPPPEKWDEWTEYEVRGWTRKQKKSYQIVPTVCFNCEASCGLLAYVNKEDGEVRKFEGHPLHPGSRGAQLRQGTCDDKPDQGPRAHPLPDEAQRSPGYRGVGTRLLG